MLSIGNSTWGWFTNGEHRIPWFYSPLYYVVKDQCGLVRYELKKGPSDHRLTRCVFVAANRRWAAAGIMDPGNGMGSVVNVAPGRFALQAEYDRVRNLPVTNSVLIYDTVEDRFVDDPWLRNLLQGLRGYRWVTGSVSITADRNWLLVFPVTAYDTDDARDVPPAKINYDGTELLREKQFLVFHRGDKKPQVVDVDRKCQPSEPQDAFVDGKGDLQLVYGVSGTVIVPLKGGNRHSCGFRFRGYRTFDTSRSVLTGFADRSLGGFVGDGAKLSCIIEVARWPYLSSNCETATVRFDDLFEVRGRTIVPGKKQAIPIGE
jgi:hypothetical protein